MTCNWCGILFSETPERIDVKWDGKTYHFCSVDCCQEFLFEKSGATEVDNPEFRNDND